MGYHPAWQERSIDQRSLAYVMRGTLTVRTGNTRLLWTLWRLIDPGWKG